FNKDGAVDLAVTDPGAGGVRVIYGKPLTVPSNTTPAAARNLGTVVHLVSPSQAIVPGFLDAWYKLTVPTEAAQGARDEVRDLSALYQYAQGGGRQMEVLDASGTALPADQVLQHFRDATGERVRVRAAQGQVLTLHVFGAAGGAGAYTLAIDVLPQVAGVEAQ